MKMSSLKGSVTPLLKSREDKFPQKCLMLHGARRESVHSGTDCKVSSTTTPTSSVTEEWVQGPSAAKCSRAKGKWVSYIKLTYLEMHLTYLFVIHGCL